MVLTKEYRICMPISVEEYHIGQLYMIARHSLEQSGDGEGVEVIENKECTDPIHGKGHYTEKHIHLSSRLPYWLQSLVPKIFYIIEKAWNYYPYTETEYTCSFIPRFSIFIKTKYEDNSGTSDNSLNLSPEELAERIVDNLDIAYDEVSPRHYKEEEDPRFFQSKKTGRGPLIEGWKNTVQPVMCSYKLVKASFEVWGLQTKVEEFIHSCIREILLLGHRQAFAWIDEWINMSYEDVRAYEAVLQHQTNTLIKQKDKPDNSSEALAEGDSPKLLPGVGNTLDVSCGEVSPTSPKSPNKKSYFSWFS